VRENKEQSELEKLNKLIEEGSQLVISDTDLLDHFDFDSFLNMETTNED
jgi:hypothetical protein